MTAPLTREAQIELMAGVAERHKGLITKWMSDPMIRSVLRQEDTSEYHMREERLVACG